MTDYTIGILIVGLVLLIIPHGIKRGQDCPPCRPRLPTSPPPPRVK